MKIVQYFTVFAAFILHIGCQSADKNVQQDNDQSCDITSLSWSELEQQYPHAIILDVRTLGEIQEGKIPESVEMNFHQEDFDDQLRTLDSSKPVIVYCKVGGRAGETCKRLHEMGFSQVFNYGGYDRYLDETTK